MSHFFQRTLFTVGCATFASHAYAEVPSWRIVPKESEIAFTAKQNGADVRGTFKDFKGDIRFDPNQLDKSSVTLEITIDSMEGSSSDVLRTLLTADWFDAKKFPKALFTAHSFVKDQSANAKPNSFQAMGQLQLRDKTAPVTLSFVLGTYTPEKAVATGSATLKRTAFGVGQGEWSSSAVVDDGVAISFKISAQHPGK